MSEGAHPGTGPRRRRQAEAAPDPPVDDPVARRIPWEPVTRMHDPVSPRDPERPYHLVSGGPGRWVIRRRENPGRAVVVAVVVVVVTGAVSLGFGPLAGVAVSTLPLLVALVLAVTYAQGSVQLVVDTRLRSVWRPRVEDGDPWSFTFDEVHAFQLLRRDDETDIGECNLVLGTGRREHLLMQGGGERLAREVRRIAAEIDVPVWEVAVPPPTPMPPIDPNRAAERGREKEDSAADDAVSDAVSSPESLGRLLFGHVLSFSGVTLLLADFGPLAALFSGHWSTLTLFAIYWWQNVVVGVFAVLRLNVARPFESDWWEKTKAPLIPFFVLQYGLLLWLHGWAVTTLFAEGASVDDASWALDIGPLLGAVTEPIVALVVLSFAASRAGVFYREAWVGRHHARPNLVRIISLPHARVALLHAALLLAIILVVPLSAPRAGFAILVALHLVGDVLGDLTAIHEAREEARRHGAVGEDPRPVHPRSGDG